MVDILKALWKGIKTLIGHAARTPLIIFSMVYAALTHIITWLITGSLNVLAQLFSFLDYVETALTTYINVNLWDYPIIPEAYAIFNALIGVEFAIAIITIYASIWATVSGLRLILKAIPGVW